MARRSVLVAALCLAAAAWPSGGVAAGAPVSSVVLEDGAGDVWRWVPEDQEFVPADRPEADVLRAHVRHRRNAVVVRMRLGDLARVGDEQSFRIEMTTPKRWFGSNATLGPGAWAGRLRLIDYAEERFVRCERDDLAVDYSEDRVRVRVPRSCIGRPAWVRLSISNEAFIGGAFYGDNPHTHDVDLRSTRRLYRAPR